MFENHRARDYYVYRLLILKYNSKIYYFQARIVFKIYCANKFWHCGNSILISRKKVNKTKETHHKEKVTKILTGFFLGGTKIDFFLTGFFYVSKYFIINIYYFRVDKK